MDSCVPTVGTNQMNTEHSQHTVSELVPIRNWYRGVLFLGVHEADPRESPPLVSVAPSLFPKPDCKSPSPARWEMAMPVSPRGKKSSCYSEVVFLKFGTKEAPYVCTAGSSGGTGDTAQVPFLFHLRNTSQPLIRISKMDKGLCKIPPPICNQCIQKNTFRK